VILTATALIANRFLKGQDLSGVLPASLAKLPYLKNMYTEHPEQLLENQFEFYLFLKSLWFYLFFSDLNRNYLSGTIPPEWASTKLEFMWGNLFIYIVKI